MDRARCLLRTLTKEARLIEVGPSFRPLAPKREGWNTFVIDHASREDLIVKYADQDTASIEELDFVWRGGSLADAVPQDRHGTFDAVIASHVIEHTTDVVTFLKAAGTLIRPDGVVVLAVPDKRKCFDFYRSLSTVADAIVAYQERRERHDTRTHIEYGVRAVLKGGGPGWTGSDTRPPAFVSPLDQFPRWLQVADLPYCVDAHNWVFVPSSFSLMIAELAGLGYLDLRVEEVAEADASEFHAWLRKGRDPLSPDELQRRRRALMDRVVIELADQSRQVPGNTISTIAGLQDQLVEATNRAEAMQTVLLAVQSSTGWLGLDRRKFRALIARAARSIPGDGPASGQHCVLLAEARKVLGLEEPT